MAKVKTYQENAKEKTLRLYVVTTCFSLFLSLPLLVCPHFPLWPIPLYKKKICTQQKKRKKKKKNYLKCSDTKGNCSIDFQCAGCVQRAGKQNYLLVVYFLFLCHLSCVISFVYLFAAFECICSFRNGKEKHTHSLTWFPLLTKNNNQYE